jgi:hypothetical protein
MLVSYGTYWREIMALGIRQILCGGKYNFRLIEKLGDKTVRNPVFKAEVLPGVETVLPIKPW